METDNILRDLVILETRVFETQKRIARYREMAKSAEASGNEGGFAAIMLGECERVLAIHLSLHERLLRQL